MRRSVGGAGLVAAEGSGREYLGAVDDEAVEEDDEAVEEDEGVDEVEESAEDSGPLLAPELSGCISTASFFC